MLMTLPLLAILTSLISGIVGMGGGVLLLSLMTLVAPYSIIIPIHGVTQLTSNSSRAFLLRKNIKRDWILFYILGSVPGAVLAVFFLKNFDLAHYPKLLICFLIFYVVLKPKKMPELIIPNSLWILVGFISGILSLLVGATGPFLASFFIRSDLDKKQIVATKAFMQFFSHFLKIPAFLYLEFPYKDYILLIILMSLGATIGSKLGVTILERINQKIFKTILKIVLFASALRILYTVYY